MIFKLHIKQTLDQLLAQEDTDGDKKITIDDRGPKKFEITNELGHKIAIEGTYYLSNLLQELALAQKAGNTFCEIPLAYIQENPVDRISRKIKTLFWDGLTRSIDHFGLEKILEDEKTESDFQYLYVPEKDPFAMAYFKDLEQSIPRLQVLPLPDAISDDFSLSLNKKPGLLALALQVDDNQKVTGIPFVVPGGRFNEMYGWDSYFIAVGLLIDGKIALAKGTAEHFKYQIDHYGKILNANRSYYLTRTQPPFYTSLLMDVVNAEKVDTHWLFKHLQTAITEYHLVWMQTDKRLTANGLNRYKAEGVGLPFEVEPGHFDDILEQFAQKYNLPLREFEQQYLDRTITDAALDAYFIHDRSMRESGHDTTNRLVGVCANLNPVALNSLLYKYETDIAYLIAHHFENHFQYNESTTYSSSFWTEKAQNRKQIMNELCWNETKGMYFDYDFVNNQQHLFEAATTFYPLWAQLCSPEQAQKLVENVLPKFKMKGGIAGSTPEMLAQVADNAPVRQWDYPYGWAPHQMLIWQGLMHYGYTDVAQELVYRWLWLITQNAVDYNGTIPEKYDLEISSHKIFAEYGNVGTEFSYITEEGFGWMNSSYQLGLRLLSETLRSKLALLTDPDDLF